ncbi:MAG: ABC transporter permease [Candidatus Omnitrophica bacterium]|nr:ABC transporter permease [Candidatus Omnitrophota bacterium]
MRGYIIKRLLFSLPLLLGVTLITFIFIQLAPGDFLSNLKSNPQVSREVIKIYEEKFHLNEPVIKQYVIWLWHIGHFDLGYSFTYQSSVNKVITSRAFNTLILSFSTIVFTWLCVIPLGILAVLHRNKFIDRLISFVSYIGISTPSFFLAFIFLFFAYKTGILPLGGMRSLRFEYLSFWGKLIDVGKHLILPTLVLSIGSISSLQRIMRGNLLEVLGSQYILASRARGISERRILYIHVLKNALNPMITIFGYQLSSLLSGAALTEIIVGWPGLGQVTLEAVRKQDIYLVMGSVLISGLLLILGNLFADILLAFSDPRIRYEREV